MEALCELEDMILTLKYVRYRLMPLVFKYSKQKKIHEIQRQSKQKVFQEVNGLLQKYGQFIKSKFLYVLRKKVQNIKYDFPISKFNETEQQYMNSRQISKITQIEYSISDSQENLKRENFNIHSTPQNKQQTQQLEFFIHLTPQDQQKTQQIHSSKYKGPQVKPKSQLDSSKYKSSQSKRKNQVGSPKYKSPQSKPKNQVGSPKYSTPQRKQKTQQIQFPNIGKSQSFLLSGLQSKSSKKLTFSESSQNQATSYLKMTNLYYLMEKYLDFDYFPSLLAQKEDKQVQCDLNQADLSNFKHKDPYQNQLIEYISDDKKNKSRTVISQKISPAQTKQNKLKTKKNRRQLELEFELESIIYGKDLFSFIEEYLHKNNEKKKSPSSAATNSKSPQKIKSSGKKSIKAINLFKKKSSFIQFFTKSKGYFYQESLYQSTYQRLVIICFDTLLFSLKNMEYFLPLGYLSQIVNLIKREEIHTLQSDNLKLCEWRIQRCCKQITNKMRNLRKELKQNYFTNKFVNMDKQAKINIDSIRSVNQSINQSDQKTINLKKLLFSSSQFD